MSCSFLVKFHAYSTIFQILYGSKPLQPRSWTPVPVPNTLLTTSFAWTRDGGGAIYTHTLYFHPYGDVYITYIHTCMWTEKWQTYMFYPETMVALSYQTLFLESFFRCLFRPSSVSKCFGKARKRHRIGCVLFIALWTNRQYKSRLFLRRQRQEACTKWSSLRLLAVRQSVRSSICIFFTLQFVGLLKQTTHIFLATL